MFGRCLMLALAALAAPASAQYEVPDPAPEPVAQLAEMVELYDRICLRAFPDDHAVARLMRDVGTPLSPAEVQRYLRDDPGVGWRIAGRSARFDVTIEAPPYHACAVRTMTAAGFPGLDPYRALADRFEAEQGGGFEPIPPLDGTVGTIRTSGRGESRQTGTGKSEALLIFVGMPAEALRTRRRTGVEIRFVHQFAEQPAH